MAWKALEGRRAEWESLLDEAKAFAQRVRQALGEARVYLYGSVARGEFNVESDIDLLVVSPRLPEDPLERFTFLQRLNLGRVEARGLTPEEFARLRAKGALWWLEGAREL